MAGTVAGTDLARYRKKIMHFLKDEANHITLHKLRTNKPITSTDIKELERILFESGDYGTRDDFEKAFDNPDSLGIFVRSLIGLDREEAMRAFNEFLDGQRFNSNQIEFVNMIINYLTQNGVMMPRFFINHPTQILAAMG